MNLTIIVQNPFGVFREITNELTTPMIKPSHQQTPRSHGCEADLPDRPRTANPPVAAQNPGNREVSFRFLKNRDSRKGTREWSDTSYNICIGCEHGCLYCYAKSNRCRFDKTARVPGEWQKQQLNPNRSLLGSEIASHGVVMFPTSHDIVPGFVDECLTTIRNLLVKNDVLVVSKPHLSVIKRLCESLIDCRHKLLFRFTIGSLNKELCKFWEPGAPDPAERIQALAHTWDRGYATSVSIEPMLDSVEETIKLVERIDPFVTDSIWIGKMQRIPIKHNLHITDFAKARMRIRMQQSNQEILRLVSQLEQNPKVRWKDSIKKVLQQHKLI